jgi:hypothetical protein
VDSVRRATLAQKALKGQSSRGEGPERPEFPRMKAKSLAIETPLNYVNFYTNLLANHHQTLNRRPLHI